MEALLKAIRDAVESGSVDETAIKEAYQGSTKGLSDKVDDLAAEVKKWRKRALSKADEGDTSELHDKIESLQDQLKEKNRELEKVQQQFDRESKKLATALEAEQKAVSSLVVDHGLTEALSKVGVTNPAYVKAARAILQGQVEVVSNGDTREATIEGKPLVDFVAEWAQGDEGKQFVKPRADIGGGAGGAIFDHSAGKPFSEMSLKERSELAKLDPELYRKMKQE
jgi:predicted RNase H-like nuclease (RuvC/YqgF family)